MSDLDLAQLWRPKERQEVPVSHMQLLSNFAATWGRADGPNFGIHCGTCGKDVVAKNGTDDRVLRVSCDCKEYLCDPRAICV
jgi:hypothetical protein